MIFCIFMPLFLSMIYSYSTDYQPQGRYLLPALLPLCYYTVRGLEKLYGLIRLRIFSAPLPERLLSILSAVLCILMAGMLILTVYGYAFPYYESNPVAP